MNFKNALRVMSFLVLSVDALANTQCTGTVTQVAVSSGGGSKVVY
jgi:hypothetical protein